MYDLSTKIIKGDTSLINNLNDSLNHFISNRLKFNWESVFESAEKENVLETLNSRNIFILSGVLENYLPIECTKNSKAEPTKMYDYFSNTDVNVFFKELLEQKPLIQKIVTSVLKN